LDLAAARCGSDPESFESSNTNHRLDPIICVEIQKIDFGKLGKGKTGILALPATLLKEVESGLAYRV